MRYIIFFVILILLSSCTLFIDRKNVIKSIPGYWNMTIINGLDTSKVRANFKFKRVNNDYVKRKFEIRNSKNDIILEGDYVLYGIKSSTYLILKDTTSNFTFEGEVTNFKYQTDKKDKKRPVKYIEFIDTVKKSNKVIKIQMSTN